MLGLVRIPASSYKSTGHILPLSPDSSPSSTSATVKETWESLEFSFIPVRRAHLDLLGFAYGRVPPPIEELHGNTMVDRDYMPLGFCFVWFEPSGTVSLHAHFGKWLKAYPKDILRGMHATCNELRQMGVRLVHCTADPGVDGSLTLVRWLRGEGTGQVGEMGPVYVVDLHKTKI